MKKAKNSIGDYFDNSITYNREEYLKANPQPTAPVQPAVQKGLNQASIISALHQLESSGGKDPAMPPPRDFYYDIPAANGNEKVRRVNYNSGRSGEFGLSPVAIADLASSSIDQDADPSTWTAYGKPLIAGRKPEEIQEMLKTFEGTSQLAYEFFLKKRANKEDLTPESLANDYINNYWGLVNADGTPRSASEITNNKARALAIFNSFNI